MWNPEIRSKLIDYAEDAARVRSSRHAACIVHRGHIIGMGRNKLKTHPMMFRFSGSPKKVYLHAEIDAIVRVIREYGTEILSKSSLYVLRLNKTDMVASSKPCPVCQKAIEAFGLQSYWTD